MNSIDWKRKLTSRKLWAAIALFVSGLMTAMGREASEAETISGLIMQGAAVIAYIIGEGLNDYANAGYVYEGKAAGDTPVVDYDE